MEDTPKKQKLGLLTGLYLVFAISFTVVAYMELNKVANGELFEKIFSEISSTVIFISSIIIYIICTFIYFFKLIIDNLEEENLEEIKEEEKTMPSLNRPAAISYLLYRENAKGRDITSTILDLINRNFLILEPQNTIEEVLDSTKSIILNKNINANMNTLSEYEKILLRWLIDEIGDAKKVYTGVIRKNLKENPLVLQKYKMFQKAIKAEIINEGLYNEKVKKSITPYIAIGFLVLSLSFRGNLNAMMIIFSIIECLLLKIFFKDTKQRALTDKGITLAEKWQGYKVYLAQKEQITIEDLVYKVAIGCNIKEECLFKLDDVFNKERRKK